MSLIPIDAQHINTAIIQDATNVRQFLDWANLRYNSYNQSLTTQVMNTAGIASGDQTFILAFIADLNRINTLAGGTLPATADNINFNINSLLGLQP